MRQYRLANKSKIAETWKNYHTENKEKIKAKAREREDRDIAGHKARRKNQHLRRQYSITLKQFNEKLEDQDNKCGVCREVFDTSSKAKTPHVDHNHTTGLVRALLCHNCNVALGLFGEDPTKLVAALAYLEAWK